MHLFVSCRVSPGAVGDGEDEEDPARTGCLHTQDASSTGKGETIRRILTPTCFQIFRPAIAVRRS